MATSAAHAAATVLEITKEGGIKTIAIGDGTTHKVRWPTAKVKTSTMSIFAPLTRERLIMDERQAQTIDAVFALVIYYAIQVWPSFDQIKTTSAFKWMSSHIYMNTHI